MRFLTLASSRFGWQLGDPYVHPAAIDVSVTGVAPMVGISEGAAHGAVGGAFPVETALEPVFAHVFDAAGGEWVRSYLLRMRDGDPVEERELVLAFRARHGRDPEAFDWELPIERS